MSVQQVQQSSRPTPAALPHLPTERHRRAFSQVADLPLSFSLGPDAVVGLCRARMDNRDVVLRVLKGRNHAQQRQACKYRARFSWLNALSSRPLPQNRPAATRSSTSWVLPPSSPVWGRTPSCRRCWAWFRRSRLC